MTPPGRRRDVTEHAARERVGSANAVPEELDDGAEGLLVVVAFLSLGGVMTASTLTLRGSLYRERELKMKDAVELAHGVLEHFHRLAREGRLGDDEAKAAAVRAIRDLRYEGQNYFWITDRAPRMVIHPFMPELDGMDLTNERDPNGKRLFVESAEVVRRDGAGFVSYLWPKPGLTEPVRKLSYVKGFDPWGWIVGTGTYLATSTRSIAGR